MPATGNLSCQTICQQFTHHRHINFFAAKSPLCYGKTKEKFVIMAFGDYPAEYNPKVHGPYDPARFHGKPDTPFGQLKVGEITSWLARREKTPRAVAGAFSRAWLRWNHKYVLPKRAGIAPLFQLIGGAMVFFYVINYGKIKHHRNYKYH